MGDLTPVDIGRAVRAARNKAGWTQAQLAERCGTFQGRIADIEAGRHDIGTARLAAIAATLDVSLADLVRMAEAGRQVEGER
jgi:transcriptional regulator with XRE-family HTH domain